MMCFTAFHMFIMHSYYSSCWPASICTLCHT